MAETRQPSLNVLRGTRGAVAGGLAAVALVVVLGGGFVAARWRVEGATEFRWGAYLRTLRKDLAFPLLGCGAVGAAAGWAASAPRGRHRFAWSLAVVSLLSLPLWPVLWSLELTPRRGKGVDQPAVYPSEALVLVSPPLVVAAVLGFVRARQSGSPVEAEPSAAADRGACSAFETEASPSPRGC